MQIGFSEPGSGANGGELSASLRFHLSGNPQIGTPESYQAAANHENADQHSGEKSEQNGDDVVVIAGEKCVDWAVACHGKEHDSHKQYQHFAGRDGVRWTREIRIDRTRDKRGLVRDPGVLPAFELKGRWRC
jgi:hypothetical protein